MLCKFTKHLNLYYNTYKQLITFKLIFLFYIHKSVENKHEIISVTFCLSECRNNII